MVLVRSRASTLDGAMRLSRTSRDPEQGPEERQLQYVAMTRAKSQLTLVMPMISRHVQQMVAPLGNRPAVVNRSRFLPAATAEVFEELESR